jgi:hypothetical protein
MASRRGFVKLNLAPSKLAILTRRFARGLAKIPEPAPIYVVHRHEPSEGSVLISAFRNRKLAEESAARIRVASVALGLADHAVEVVEVPVEG